MRHDLVVADPIHFYVGPVGELRWQNAKGSSYFYGLYEHAWFAGPDETYNFIIMRAPIHSAEWWNGRPFKLHLTDGSLWEFDWVPGRFTETCMVTQLSLGR